MQVVPEVGQGKYGVVAEHARPGKAHHGADLFPSIRFIAVGRAVLAGGFVLAVATVVQAGQGIGLQFVAVVAQGVLAAVMTTAVKADHGFDGGSFS